ncbi:26261_t:CDS:2 [Gigaspora rosea]|nr:26261_t:CDS:2 [Gigaspora rosea]
MIFSIFKSSVALNCNLVALIILTVVLGDGLSSSENSFDLKGKTLPVGNIFSRTPNRHIRWYTLFGSTENTLQNSAQRFLDYNSYLQLDDKYCASESDYLMHFEELEDNVFCMV